MINAAQLAESLPEQHRWQDRPTADQLKPLPNSPAVYLLTTRDDQPVLLATTQQLRRLVVARLAPPQEEGASMRADIGAIARAVRWRVVSGPFEARWWYWRLARQIHPREYRKLMGFGPSWWLQSDQSGQVPELRVTERLSHDPRTYVGPWPTRKSATQALEGLWDLFDLCRYPEQVRRAPDGQRCAYADMGRCDAPCDGSAALGQYVARVQQAWDFVNGGVAGWIDAAQDDMTDAAKTLAFERAGLLKEQIKFAKRWQSDWSPHLARLADWSLLMLLPVTRRKAWKPFWLDAGCLWDGPIVQSRSLVKTLQQWQEQPPVPDPDCRSLAEDAQARSETCWLVGQLLFNVQARTAILLERDAGKLSPGWETIVEHRINASQPVEIDADDSEALESPPLTE
jgi:hypothetical protein